MARDINKRLNQLRIRRLGTDRLGQLNETARDEVIAKSYLEEEYQKRAENQPYTRYALGAMQEVDKDYTRISIETAQRVGNQLENGLTSKGFSVEFRLQGSVPLNVHIRGVSDVDLLNLDTSFYTYHTQGARSRAGLYTTPTSKTSIGVLSALRSEAEKILEARFPTATVDKSGGKAISISGGSLARPVDVVPSHWYDTLEYQSSNQERDRGVTILNKKVPVTIDNLPFVHIHRVHTRDDQTLGGLKKAIRLCKNVKNDAIEEGKTIVFPSFDIAATMYHANLDALRASYINELGVLAETQRFLDELYHDGEKAKSLMVPDGSRRIFDTDEKYQGMRVLSLEMDDLAREVAKEQDILLSRRPEFSLSDGRIVLSKAYVPAARN
ncbi:hypothetical protein [Oharaeibacter diazotrophicus]|uniref:cGAS/DncV-like nucleotidyltransferase C-terminal helical domain-containing protein n=1 Tax=Oharaeibacter diazotrophicus TaxID=1920512 RepID=A0A4R6RCL0_9HYPH|nr:hypothetical protein [Oharaeibacter diazotrophicus]TDP83931.1 hypothetical protein EDD54_2531 [Oharaeibacter diazotrophicus]BBE72973.1 hypothetical protein OHA_1_02578 [Pleomorphomonas sp. SM30]GLS74759.1 hypothetical protein GCM10007904_00940 [Oharaeibacter diazotrophicus]